jgi:aminopeptidase N
MQRLILVCALVVGLAACGPTPRQAQPELSDLYERAPRGPLPDGVRPVAYDMDLRIDPRRTRFGGTVTIDVEFDQPAQGFWLHGQGLEIRDVTVSGTNMQDEAATWRDVLNSGVAWIHFPRRASAGTVRVSIDYTAPFDANLTGLFKVDEQGNAYALAKSESIQARRFMPGFDEPRFKTPFDLTLTVPQTDTAIANTSIEREEILEEEGLKRISFKSTRPLPTYLLSLAVGPFDRLDGPSLSPNEVRDFPVPLTGYTRAGKANEISYALLMTEPMVAFFERELGVPYPYEKLDIIAAPQWPSGATELAAAITYRESRILYGPTSGPAMRRALLNIHSHEIAHMWFGDLVTPPWWDDLWLKEAFSSWATGIVLADMEPDGGYELDAVADSISAMSLDSLRSARAVREPITLNEDIRNAYDSITYDKGLAVIAMVDSYFGSDKFRPALGRYISRFEDSVADSPDFFEVIADETDEPDLTTAFRSFVEQSGLPLVSADLQCREGRAPEVSLSQSRYEPLGSPIEESRRWTIPYCLVAASGDTRERVCTMMSEQSATLTLDQFETCPDWIMPNAGGAGYWRFSLPDAQWALLAVNFGSLEAGEAMVAVDSAVASFEAGNLALPTLMAIANAAARHDQRQVVDGAVRAYSALYRAVSADEAARAGMEAEIARVFGPRLDRAAQSDLESERILASRLESFLARTGNDAELREEFARAANAYVGLPVSGEVRGLTSDDFSTALAIGMQQGGERFLDAMVSSLSDIDDPTFEQAVAYAIGQNNDPALLPVIMELSMSGQLGTRETYSIMSGQIRQSEVKQDAWAWLQANYPEFVQRIPGQRPRSTPRLADDLCSPTAIVELEALFGAYGELAPGYERALAEARESIGLCVALEAERGDEIRSYFAGFAPSETAPEDSN